MLSGPGMREARLSNARVLLLGLWAFGGRVSATGGGGVGGGQVLLLPRAGPIDWLGHSPSMGPQNLK